MNVAGLPGVDEPLGFAYVVAVMLAVVVGTLLYFRHKKWL
jgi:Mg2+ and Co2+ transporter CorA